MALVPKGVSNSTAATTEHFRSSSAFYSFIHPFHKYPLSKHYGPATAPGTGNSVVNEPRRISAVKQFIFLLGKMTKYRSKLVGKESGKCCRGDKAGLGFPRGTRGKEPACQHTRSRRHGFDPWVGKIPLEEGIGSPLPAFLPGEPHGQRSLAG